VTRPGPFRQVTAGREGRVPAPAPGGRSPAGEEAASGGAGGGDPAEGRRRRAARWQRPRWARRRLVGPVEGPAAAAAVFLSGRAALREAAVRGRLG